jgi:hypothetical protein
MRGRVLEAAMDYVPRVFRHAHTEAPMKTTET